MTNSLQPNAPNHQSELLPVFLAPKLKLERAEKHILEVIQMRDEYLAQEPIELRIEESDLMPNTAAWVFRVINEPPSSIALAFGDAIHNLRSALDILINDAVRNNGKDLKHVCFPFSETESKYPEHEKKSGINRAGPKIYKFISGLRPTHETSPWLFSLHHLDIVDKHRMVLPTVSSSTIDFSGLANNAPEDTRRKLENWNTRVVDGNQCVHMPLVYGPAIGTKIKANYALKFYIPEKNYSYEIVDYLKETKSMVAKIIEVVESISNEKANYILQDTGEFQIINQTSEPSNLF